MMGLVQSVVQAVALPEVAPSRSILTTIDEVRQAVIKVAGTARRNVCIYTPDLEPQLYDQHGFLEVVTRETRTTSFLAYDAIHAVSTRPPEEEEKRRAGFA